MLVLNKRLQAILGDLFVFYHAFFKWRAVKENHEKVSFTYHKSSLYFFIFLALIHEQVLEFIAFHFLLKDRFSDSFIMILQVIHIYGIIYLIGDYNLVRRGRINIQSDKLLINVGIRKSIEIGINEIESIRKVKNENELFQSTKSFWVVATPIICHKLIGFKDEINCQITLKKQVKAYGFLGITRNIKHINLSVDNCNEFVDELNKLKIYNG
ncbi:hypothetical protein [Cohnella sp. AR92]|uniref:hypothetical protein n=1 Tax=Cohnella sp. AR92 TaxID=648716 RepID=UPI000F8EA5A0|nr:hypothetical protein [Cohnella sp. AR92]RUS45855.1 hypothetical protein ELR57_18565 [Cohnella sp. AR92]